MKKLASARPQQSALHSPPLLKAEANVVKNRSINLVVCENFPLHPVAFWGMN
jgi:hypothetical protein